MYRSQSRSKPFATSTLTSGDLDPVEAEGDELAVKPSVTKGRLYLRGLFGPGEVEEVGKTCDRCGEQGRSESSVGGVVRVLGRLSRLVWGALVRGLVLWVGRVGHGRAPGVGGR